MSPKVFILSLGCPKNLTDAEVMAGQLAAAGYEVTAKESDADIALINTCAFLSSAAAESENEIERFIALKKNGKIMKIAVTGCLVERDKDIILKKFPQIDALVGIHALDQISSALENGPRYVLPPAVPLSAPEFKLRLTAPHSAYLKVADGCDNRCSYCAIPMIRGPFRSKPLDEVLKEAAQLAGSGAKEISLIAQDTTSYGLDLYGRPKLYELLKRLLPITGIGWLRLMYVYPEKISPEILCLMRDEKKLCHYLDMPLQHISDNILKKMNRRSTERSIRNKITAIRKLVPDVAFRTNFIVGFPGETEKDFKKLLAFVSEIGFDNMGVFKYSRESGTSAAGMPGQVSEEVKTERLERLVEAQSRVIDRLNRNLIGKRTQVLLDSPTLGRSYRDAPDIDGKIKISAAGKKLKPGDLITVKITSAAGYLRRGTLIK